MIQRAKGLVRRGVVGYLRTLREANPNARRYLTAVVMQNAAAGILGTVFALYVRGAGMSTAVVGDVEGALALAAAVVCLLLPPLVGVAGYRWMLVIAGVAFGISRLGQTMVLSPSLIVALGLAYGIGDGIMRSVGVAFLSENGPAGRERTMLFTVDFVLRVIAGFVGAVLGGILPTVLSTVIPEVEALRWTIALAGLLLLGSSLPVLGVTEAPQARHKAWARYVDAIRGFRSWSRLVRLALPEGLISFGAGLIIPFVPLFLKVHLGASVAQIGFITGAAGLIMAVATLSTPLLASRFGLVGTVVITQLASLPFLLVIPLAGSLPVVALAMWARVALMNMSWPVYNQLAVEGVPTRDRPLVVGWMSVAWSLAWLGGSAIGGRLATSSYTTGYFITIALYGLGAVLSWVLLRGVTLSTEPSAGQLASRGTARLGGSALRNTYRPLGVLSSPTWTTRPHHHPSAATSCATSLLLTCAKAASTGVVTRFPPEPNGYLHIGHAKSICLNFGIASEFGGRCHLRFDDTNPIKEEQEYIDSIETDVRWLGFDWGEHLYYASDYFDRLYEWAVQLVRDGKAYVDDLSADEIREHRGTLTEPGTDSPWRDRSIEENLDLFERMRAGEFPDGSRVLRAKIDMASGNINFRDPVIYRILHAAHPRTGDAWCIYPSYDFAHGQSDAIEGITHSICTLEFQDHRPLYDWFIENLPVPSSPHQYEFARLNLTHTVLSKRVLLRLVQEGHVRGWDDPRMPTLSGIRRLGFPAEGMRDFAAMIGVARADSVVEVEMLEHAVRNVLNRTALRRFAVLDPLKVVIENYPEGQVEQMEVTNNPEDESAGTRQVPFSRELWIEREDFMEDPPKKFFRMAPGREVRLRSAYFVTCNEVVKDADGTVVELRCTYDPGDPWRQRARRPQGQSDDALALGRSRGARRGAALRPPVQRSVPGLGWSRSVRGFEPGLGDGASRLLRRTRARRARCW